VAEEQKFRHCDTQNICAKKGFIMATTTASYSTSYPSTSSSIPYPPSSSTPTTKSDPWLFNSTEIYERSPSRVDGITWPQEKELRSLGCRFIHELVTKMRRPGLPAASEAVTESAACIFFHRFFTYESFKKHHRWVRDYPHALSLLFIH
jgi:hypothetical protein